MPDWLRWLWDLMNRDPVQREYQLAQSAPRSARWPKVRQEHLLDHPECAACGSRKNLAVHHIQPYHLFPELELEPTNLLTLCEGPVVNCHFLYGHCRNWRSYAPEVVRTVAQWRVAVELARQGVAAINLD